MKLGTDSPVKTWIAIALAFVAVLLLVKWLVGSRGSVPTTTATTQTAKPNSKGVNSLDPTLHTELLKSAEETQYEGKGRNIFRSEEELPKAIVPPMSKPSVQNNLPPQPPPINVKFFGFASKPGEPKRIFLSQGEDIWVAKEGDVINRRYRILKINPNSVEIEDVLSNNRQSIPLTQS